MLLINRYYYYYYYYYYQGQTVTAEYYISKIVEKEVKPLFSRRSTTEEPVKRKQCDLRSRLRTSSYGESNTAVVQEKPPEFYPKR